MLLSVSAALAVVLLTLYRSSAGVQIETAQTLTGQSCKAIAARYAKSVPAPAAATPQIDLLQVLLQLVLLEAPHVEGGVWQRSAGVLAYAYPTYEGSSTKRDVPAAEQPLIVELAERAARTRQLQSDVVKGSREALIVSACPLAGPNNDLAAWTMTRTHAGALAAQDSLRVGLGVLTALALASGAWLGLILMRGLRHVHQLESALAQADGDAVPVLERTGIRDLDRIVDSFNRYRIRFEEARASLHQATQQRSRDQRLAALGRMTGGIAHEIRNPIAAMRLKAENALAAPPERHGDALVAIVGQIDRLEGLVQSLLALVQPVTLALRDVDLSGWLDERYQTVAARAKAAEVVIVVRHAGASHAMFDPVHLARAVDNLLDNALRHSPRHGQVTLTAEAMPSRSVVLRIDDNGPGVPEALRSQLFEPFATGRADGTGLGLALAREVALAHGGELRHLPLPSGARFELELPWRES